ncbi:MULTISPECIES: UDP-4-amino-4,6-dideoxy-N-acetyl-beta-L-altrosamine N-acetyltransferase [unclassified Blastococcus]|uniref:UDP-4-amino-4, 6-dideoxy-N-acetyl-beta-L-altrosamine N-acetyltransferase n=1 Tax=unclassified Blastococcus TaxID=2619396 RepID=UPI001EEFBB51|nr:MULTISPECIES: UDP-4-amino-4,6-dideoxy-N-acetyl-beta-L-altrosamine N-acetyltransferase [unclassified Blastococcus]
MPVGPEDRDRLREWRNDPEVARFMYTTHEIGAEEHARWFAGLLADDRRRAWVVRMDDLPVGAAFVTDIDRENRRATWAFYLADPRTRGRGVGSAVEFLVLEHAFGELGLHKLCCEVLSFNEAVVAMHTKFGFRPQGVLQDHYRRDGEWVHVHQLAMWAGDWAERRAGFEEKLRARGLLA